MRWQRIRALIQSHRVQHYIRWFSHLIERKALTPISVNALSAPHATELITDNILTENHIHVGAVQYTHLSQCQFNTRMQAQRTVANHPNRAVLTTRNQLEFSHKRYPLQS